MRCNGFDRNIAPVRAMFCSIELRGHRIAGAKVGLVVGWNRYAE